MRKTSLVMVVAACCGLGLSGPTYGGVQLSLEREGDVGTVLVNEVVPYQVWLRDFSGASALESVELDLGAPAASLSFHPEPGQVGSDGFKENDPPLYSLLNLEFDGSLLDGHVEGFADLSYVAGVGKTGIPGDSADLMLGTFWISAPNEGTYTLSLNRPGTLLLTGIGGDFGITTVDSLLTVSVPEPTGIGWLTLACEWLLCKRRVRHAEQRA